MEIKRIEKGGRGAFIAKIDGKRMAEMTYVKAGESGFIIDHTGVDDRVRGQHIGEKLVAAAVEYSRENSLKIYATCPFAIKVLQSKPEYSDVFAG